MRGARAFSVAVVVICAPLQSIVDRRPHLYNAKSASERPRARICLPISAHIGLLGVSGSAEAQAHLRGPPVRTGCGCVF